MNIFQQVKDRVTMQDILTFYSIPNKKSGKRQFCKCIFHQEKTPSMIIYDNGFKCFGCNASGDIISFVAQYFGVSNLEAAKKINGDLRLGISKGKPSKEQFKKRKYDENLVKGLMIWRDKKYNIFAAYHRILHAVTRDMPNKANSQTYMHRDLFSYYLDLLSTNDINSLLNLYKNPDFQRW